MAGTQIPEPLASIHRALLYYGIGSRVVRSFMQGLAYTTRYQPHDYMQLGGMRGGPCTV